MMTIFATSIARLAWAAGADRDGEFAAALEKCFLMVTGADMECPMGRQVLRRLISGGEMPRAPFPEWTASGSEEPARIKVRRAAVLATLFSRLQDEARHRNDERFLEALHNCRNSMDNCKFCPLHCLFNGLAP